MTHILCILSLRYHFPSKKKKQFANVVIYNFKLIYDLQYYFQEFIMENITFGKQKRHQ